MPFTAPITFGPQTCGSLAPGGAADRQWLVTDGVGGFACGTAAVITPIGRLLAEDFEIVHPGSGASELALSLREELTGIQYGRVADRHGWLVRLDG